MRSLGKIMLAHDHSQRGIYMDGRWNGDEEGERWGRAGQRGGAESPLLYPNLNRWHKSK